MPGAKLHNSDPRPVSATPPMRIGRRPKRSASGPDASTPSATAIMYAVIVNCAVPALTP
jgi:hypothetical protein